MARKKPKWKVMVERLRRRRWDWKCNYCDMRWREAKTNYPLKNGACCQCHTNICSWVRRGAAAIIARDSQIQIWRRRLGYAADEAPKSTSVQRTRLRAIAGGRR